MNQQAFDLVFVDRTGGRPVTLTLGRPHWWQWPTILSIDAPVVTVLWQRLIAAATHTSLPWAESFVLGASIWLAYAADRWIEAWRLPASQVRTQRHHFAQRWRWPIAACWMVVLTIDLAVALTRLTSAELAAGVVVLAMALTYLLSHQLVHREHPWRAPKELCIAVLLTCGVALFTTTVGTLGAVAPWLAAFALLGFTNCALIAAWEQEVDETHDAMSLARQFRRGSVFGRWLPWIVAAMSGAVLASPLTRGGASITHAAFCAALGALLLGAVDVLHRTAGRELARVLADVALIAPVLLLLLMGIG